MLLEQTLLHKLDKPFISIPPEGALPAISGKSFWELMGKLASVDTLKELEKSEIVKKHTPAKMVSSPINDATAEHKMFTPIKVNKNDEPFQAFIGIQARNEEVSKNQESLNSQLETLRLKSEIDVLKTTVHHLKEQLSVYRFKNKNRAKMKL